MMIADGSAWRSTWQRDGNGNTLTDAPAACQDRPREGRSTDTSKSQTSDLTWTCKGEN